MHRSLRTSSMRHGKPRRQDRNTPRYMVDAVRAVIGRPELDPCSNPRSIVGATCEVYYGGKRSLGREPKLIEVVGDTTYLRGDGLGLHWPRYRTIFGNVPWGTQGAWIRHAASVAARKRIGSTVFCPRPTIMFLVPLRTHRSYWPWAWTADAICFLKPVAFVGFKNQMPVPCAMLLWGSDYDVSVFIDVFHNKLGTVLTGFPVIPKVVTMKNGVSDDTMTHMLATLLSSMSDKQIAELIADTLPNATMMDLMQLPDEFIGNACHQQIYNATALIMERVKVSQVERPGVKRKKPSYFTKKTALGGKRRSKRKTTTRMIAKAKKAPPKNGKSKMTNGVAAKAKSNAGDPDLLDKTIRDQILKGRQSVLKTAEVSKAMKVSPATALRALKRLVAAGDAKATGQGRGAGYESLVS